ELGQPTHAFDLARLDPEPKMPEKTIVVRSAREGETLVTLDGVERRLTPEMTVIADSQRPVALAGVMGGRETEVDESTTELFVEVAAFDPVRTRRTRRLAGLSTDASYRFERGIDPALPPQALVRVAALIVSLAGGNIDAPPVDLHGGDPVRAPLVLRVSRAARVIGISLDAAHIARLLVSIGCDAVVEDGGAILTVTAPSWRRDLAAEIDLLEEVARLHGFARLPDEIRPYRPGRASDAPLWITAARVRAALVGAGLLEAKPTPFVSGGDEHVRVLNPLAENEAHLRRTVLESLARRAEHNLAHMEGNVRLFEIGAAFARGGEALPDETLRVGVLVMGDREPAHFTNARPLRFDAWDAKGIAELVTHAALPGATAELLPAAGEGMLWEIRVDGAIHGIVTRVGLDAPVWAAPAFGVELVLGTMSNNDIAPAGENAHGDPESGVERLVRRFVPLPTYPPAEFDLALLVPHGVRAADVERVIRDAAGDLLERLVAFDLYEGAGVDAGHRSVAWRLTLRHRERTLREKEIEGRRSKILSALQSELHVRQRST
nr:phenylalanine--tRNA ligase subunit beta [Gemmatimonadaceae bacterium]